MKKLLGEAAEWRLLSLLFECPSAGWREQISSLAGEVEDAELRAATEQALEQASEGLYHSIFGPGGPASPREITYQNTVQAGYFLSELLCYYESFAFRPVSLEPPDHVSMETGFVGYLRLKEAFALESSDVEHAAVTREAAEKFIEEHLSNISGPLAAALSGSGIGYLTLAGGALLRRVPARGGHKFPFLDKPDCDDWAITCP